MRSLHGTRKSWPTWLKNCNVIPTEARPRRHNNMRLGMPGPSFQFDAPTSSPRHTHSFAEPLIQDWRRSERCELSLSTGDPRARTGGRGNEGSDWIAFFWNIGIRAFADA